MNIQSLLGEVNHGISRNIDIPPLSVVRMHIKIREGEKERIQKFEGIVIAVRGHGSDKTITVRRNAPGGMGVERIFPIASPNVDKIEVLRVYKSRRSKPYFIRDLTGKKLSAKLNDTGIKAYSSDDTKVADAEPEAIPKEETSAETQTEEKTETNVEATKDAESTNPEVKEESKEEVKTEEDKSEEKTEDKSETDEEKTDAKETA